MRKQTLEFLKEAAPESLLEATTNVIDKKNYKDGDILNLFEKNAFKEKKYMMNDLLKHLIVLEKYYDFGEKDLAFKDEVRTQVEKENQKSGRKEQKEKTGIREEEKIEYWINKNDKEKIKESLKIKENLKKSIEEHMIENPEKKQLILESVFEAFEEGILNEVSKKAIQQMKTEKEKEQLEKMLKERNSEFREAMEKAKYLSEFFEYYNNEYQYDLEGEYSEELEEVYMVYSMQRLINAIAPMMNEFLESDELKNEEWSDYPINELAKNELELYELSYSNKESFVLRGVNKDKKMKDLVNYLVEVLEKETIYNKNINKGYTEEAFEFVRKLKKNPYNLNTASDHKKIEEKLNLIFVNKGVLKEDSPEEKEEFFFSLIAISSIYYGEEYKEKFNELINHDEKEFFKGLLKKVHVDELCYDTLKTLLEYFFEEEVEELREAKIRLINREIKDFLKILVANS